MKNVISLVVITILLSLSTASADMMTTSFNASAGVSSNEDLEASATGETEVSSNEDSEASATGETEVSSNEDLEASATITPTVKNTPIKDIQKEFIGQYKELKAKYKGEMGNTESRKKFLEERNTLFIKYKAKLSEAAKMRKGEVRQKFEAKRKDMEAKGKEMKKRGEERRKDMEAKGKEMREKFEAKKEEVSKRVKAKREKYRAKREELRLTFRASLNKNKKLHSRIDKIGDANLKRLLVLIDKIITKTENNTSMSDAAVNNKLATLNALKDIINAKLSVEVK